MMTLSLQIEYREISLTVHFSTSDIHTRLDNSRKGLLFRLATRNRLLMIFQMAVLFWAA